MPEKATYIHGTDASEQHRLVELNRLTNGPFIDFLGIRPDSRAIEVGSRGRLARSLEAHAANLFAGCGMLIVLGVSGPWAGQDKRESESHSSHVEIPQVDFRATGTVPILFRRSRSGSSSAELRTA